MATDPQPAQRASRTAPVQNSRGSFRVPWDVHVRAWQVYAALGHGDQSAARIAERGGFGCGEMIRLLSERDPWGETGWEPLSEQHKRRLSGIRTAGLEAL